MLINKPYDKTGHEYHVVNLYGQTVHAYLSRESAERSLEGDQRIFVYHYKTQQWIGGAPTVHPDILEEIS